MPGVMVFLGDNWMRKKNDTSTCPLNSSYSAYKYADTYGD